MNKSAQQLRRKIARVLRKQGYSIKEGRITIPEASAKQDLKRMHQVAVKHKIETAEPRLRRHEERLLPFIANGSEVKPDQVLPELLEVKPNSVHELLFRYAALHWSIPVSSGYGRRLRFVVMDRSNNKLIGILGLGDPVYALNARDNAIGWSPEIKRQNLYHVMDAYVLGAVPPYSELLCGKLVAMLALSNEVRDAFKSRYENKKTLIGRKMKPPYLALITTTSAFGRSSMYNRLRIDSTIYWSSVGFTRGSGDFHFSNGLYGDIRTLVEKTCEPTAKQESWGSGFRNKREVIRKGLNAIGLSEKLIYHGIKREVYMAALGVDALAFLKGEKHQPKFYDWPAQYLSQKFRSRWLLRRASTSANYRVFDRESYRLWPAPKSNKPRQ
jgi:hypothetical protein